MINKIRKFFSSLRPKSDKEQLEYDIEKLRDDLQKLIIENNVQRLENKHKIDEIQARHKMWIGLIKDDPTKIIKRCVLRRILGMRKRIKILDRVDLVFRDNIHVHEVLVERLEDMRVSGLKIITADMLEEITLDNQEKYDAHREIVDSIDAIATDNSDPADDPDLKSLEKELGL